MLLYQYGTYDFAGTGETFQLDITRQFILPGEDEPYQLSLTFHFAPTPPLKKLKPASQWCPLPAGVDEFRKALLASPAYGTVANEPVKKVELDFEQC